MLKRIKKRMAGLFFILFIVCSTASAHTKFFVDGQIGPGSLGFQSPHLSIGLTAETVFKRFESDSSFAISPDVKTFATKGHSFNLKETAGIWILKRLELRGGIEYSLYYSEVPVSSTIQPDGYFVTEYRPYKKGGVTPLVGISIKDSWFGSPGRFDLDYGIPTGCVFATPANPCRITSPRERTLIGQQEFELWPRLHYGIRGGWVNYGDQVNPQSAIPQTRHNTGFAEVVIRYELRK